MDSEPSFYEFSNISVMEVATDGGYHYEFAVGDDWDDPCGITRTVKFTELTLRQFCFVINSLTRTSREAGKESARREIRKTLGTEE